MTHTANIPRNAANATSAPDDIRVLLIQLFPAKGTIEIIELIYFCIVFCVLNQCYGIFKSQVCEAKSTRSLYISYLKK